MKVGRPLSVGKKECLVCKKLFKPRKNSALFCSLKCYRIARKRRGWFVNVPELERFGRGCVSRSMKRQILTDNGSFE